MKYLLPSEKPQVQNDHLGDQRYRTSLGNNCCSNCRLPMGKEIWGTEKEENLHQASQDKILYRLLYTDRTFHN